MKKPLPSFDQVIGTDTSNRSALENKGKAYYYLGRHEDAIVWYDRAPAVSPVNLFIWYNKSIAFAQSWEV